MTFGPKDYQKDTLEIKVFVQIRGQLSINVMSCPWLLCGSQSYPMLLTITAFRFEAYKTLWFRCDSMQGFLSDSVH